MKKWKIEMEEREYDIRITCIDDKDDEMIWYFDKDMNKVDIIKWITEHVVGGYYEYK